MSHSNPKIIYFGIGVIVSIIAIFSTVLYSKENNNYDCSHVPNIKQNIEYSEAKKIILKAGWQMPSIPAYGYTEDDPKVISSCFGSDNICNEYPEIDACSGSGYCNMQFFDCHGQQLIIHTYGELGNGAYIESWEITK